MCNILQSEHDEAFSQALSHYPALLPFAHNSTLPAPQAAGMGAPPPPPAPPQSGPSGSVAVPANATSTYQLIQQTPPHQRRPFPPHLRGLVIPYKPVINLAPGPAVAPGPAGAPPTTSPPRRLLTPPPFGPKPTNHVPLPRPAKWWVYGSEQLSGSFIAGTRDPAYRMDDTEVVGKIRGDVNGPWYPVIADLKHICPCYLRHGDVCQRRIKCNSTPQFDEICFNPMNTCKSDCVGKVHLQTTCKSLHDHGRCLWGKGCKHGHDVGERYLRQAKADEHRLHHP